MLDEDVGVGVGQTGKVRRSCASTSSFGPNGADAAALLVLTMAVDQTGLADQHIVGGCETHATAWERGNTSEASIVRVEQVRPHAVSPWH